MILIIVESPTKSKTIRKFLGKEYQVVSSKGHVRNLPRGRIGIEVNDKVKMDYVIPIKARKTVNLLKKEIKDKEKIILATDRDREGEAIAWHITQVLQLGKFQIQNLKFQTNSKHQIQNSKPYQRIVFNEISEKAIKAAIKNPLEINMNLVEAQQARRALDRIVGYELSLFLWKKIFRGLSAGRVQSVALKIIVDREREIERFKSEEYWSIVILFFEKKNKVEFEATLFKKDNKNIPKLGIKTKEQKDQILKDLEKSQYKIVSIQTKEVIRNSLPPFKTSSLQQECWKNFGFSAKMTMSLAQGLYERGYITYHRTDSLNLSTTILKEIKIFIEKKYGKKYFKSFKTYQPKSKVASQEAHEAIRVTNVKNQLSVIKNKLKPNEAKIYQLIWQRTIACQMTPAVFDAMTIKVITFDKDKSNLVQYEFQAKEKDLKFDGWLKVYPALQIDNKQDRKKQKKLSLLKKQDIVEAKKIIPQQHFTKPLPRYNEASLIKILEQEGVGRPSTYANIISKIQERRYVERQGKQLVPTKNGLMVNDFLVKNFSDIINIKFTVNIEEELNKIAENKKNWELFIKHFYNSFMKNLKDKYQKTKKIYDDEPTEKICEKCQSKMIIKTGRFGKFLACSNFPDCKNTKSIEKPEKKSLNIDCPQCFKGEIVEKRTRKGKIFYGCEQWPDCDFALWDKPIDEKCQECNALLTIDKKGKTKCSNSVCQTRIKKLIKKKNSKRI